MSESYRFNSSWESALEEVSDIFGRLGITFFAIGKTLQFVLNDIPGEGEITIAIKLGDIYPYADRGKSPYIKSLQQFPDEIQNLVYGEKLITFNTSNNTLVKIKVLKNWQRFPSLQNLDIKLYQDTNGIYIPNQLKKFLKIERFLS